MKAFMPFWCSILILCIAFGCAGPPSQLPPSSVNMNVSLTQLRQDFEAYDVYYSAKLHNPSAILFVPTSSEYSLELDWRWHTIDTKERLNRLLGTIEVIYPQLSVIMTPSPQDTGQREALAYIYTPAYASVRKTDQPQTFFLRHVPEQPHPDFGAGDGRVMD
jgi:hypothetical protein